ncbi:hypothetical protein MMC30_003074 [Trapelia coarctata]|nr:hypothetical protein [Trapelia coarctata]
MPLPIAPFIKKQQTWIDKRGLTKKVPLKLLCFGLSRTGTSSLRVALWELGLEAYHAFAILENPPDGVLWQQALRAKFEGKGPSFTKADFDSLFYDCHAVIDLPSYLFVEELLAAYPEAKVLVTTREFESWRSSCTNTIVTPWKSRFGRVAEMLDKAASMKYMPPLRLAMDVYFWGDFQQNAKAVFHAHYAKVKRLAPTDRYLEYDIKEGWGPLCQFLEVNVPEDGSGKVKPFPNINDRETFNRLFNPLARIPVLFPGVLKLMAFLMLVYGLTRAFCC